MKNISVIGLGKLGSSFLVAAASRNINIIGVDKNKIYVDLLQRGKANVFEPDLQDYLVRYQKYISVTTDIKYAVDKSNITFIIVPTPSDKNGNFSTTAVEEVCKTIGDAIKSKNEFHLVVVVSTVLPLSMSKKIKPVLEKYSEKKCGLDFGLCYNAEFIALGSVIRNLLNPDFILIGESDNKSGLILSKFYKDFCLNKPPIRRMSFENAELTKIALNSYVTLKISYANFLAEICEKLPGGDVDKVTSALGLDQRIGTKYLKGALGFGGPCFPRDNKALAFISKQLGSSYLMPDTSDAVNEYQVQRISKIIKHLLPYRRNGKVGILGLSYKPDTNVVEESQSVLLAKKIKSKDCRVFVYDPVSIENVKKELGNGVGYLDNIEKAVTVCDLLIIATPWKNIKGDILIAISKHKSKKITIFDIWRIFSSEEIAQLPSNVKHYSLGKSLFLTNK